MKRSPLLLVLTGVFVALLASGCAAGNPNISAAEDALEDQNYEQALASVDQALQADSANADAYMLRARILSDQANNVEDPARRAELIQQMVDAYDQAISIDPDLRSEVQNRLFLTYQQEMRQGVEAFQRANQNQDTEAFSEAADYFASAAAVEPDTMSDAALNQAYALINAQRASEAIGPLEDVIENVESQPDSVASERYVLLAQLYAQEGQNEEAVTLLEQAREQLPENADVEAELLNAYARSGDTERAMTYYEQAIEREPQNETYRYNYGSMLLNADRYDEAIEQLERAVELDPSYANAQYNLGAAYVNKAADQATAIREIDAELTEGRDQMSDQDIQARETEMQDLSEDVRELFRQAIPPLERAREMSDGSDTKETSICEVLFRAYVQTGQQDKAQEAAECAGIEG